MLINTGRGALVDTPALIDALKNGQLGYLGLDVYEEEAQLFFEDRSDLPLQDDVLARLLTFPNVIITAHQAFLTHEALGAIAADYAGTTSRTGRRDRRRIRSRVEGLTFYFGDSEDARISSASQPKPKSRCFAECPLRSRNQTKTIGNRNTMIFSQLSTGRLPSSLMGRATVCSACCRRRRPAAAGMTFGKGSGAGGTNASGTAWLRGRLPKEIVEG